MSKHTTMSPQQRRRDLIKAVRSYARNMVMYVVLSLFIIVMYTINVILAFSEPSYDWALPLLINAALFTGINLSYWKWTEPADMKYITEIVRLNTCHDLLERANMTTDVPTKSALVVCASDILNEHRATSLLQ